MPPILREVGKKGEQRAWDEKHLRVDVVEEPRISDDSKLFQVCFCVSDCGGDDVSNNI